VVKALESGKHVFVEKPLCRTTAELASIKQLWAGHGGRVKMSSNLVLRAAPLYLWLKAQIAEGRFGEIYAFDGDYLYGRLHKITEGWRGSVDDYSVIKGGGVHLLDLLVWLTGQRPASVVAMGNGISTRDSKFRYDDYISATLQCPSGLVARITANFGSVHRHQHVVKVYGTSATFIYDDAGARLHESRDPQTASREIEMNPLPASKGALIEGFVDSIERNVDITSDTESHFDVISISAACDEALTSRTLTEVHYV
jgi:predicted dehydrogenase